MAQGVQDLTAPQYKAQKVVVFGGQGVVAREAHNRHDHASHREKKGRGWFGRSSSSDFQSSCLTSVGMSVEAAEAHFISGGDITLTNPHFAVDKTVLTALDGVVQILQGTNYYSSFFCGKSADMFWQSMTARSVQSQTYTDPEFSGTVEVQATETIVQQVCGRTLAFMDKLDVQKGKLTIEFVRELYDVKEQSVSGPTAALSAVIALAASIAAVATGGAALVGNALASSAGLTTTATVAGVTTTSLTTAGGIVAAMGSAGFSALCAQSAMAIVMNKGNLGRAAQQLAGKDSIKALLMAMGTAGLNKGLGLGPIDSRLITGLINKQKPGEIITGIVVDQVAAFVAQRIGEAKLDGFTHKLAHAAAGAAAGAALSKDRELGALSGAVGAAVAETLADVMKDKSQELRKKALEKADELGIEPSRENLAGIMRDDLQTIIDVSHLGGAVAALLMGLDPDVAANAAANALYNNFALSSVKEALEGYVEGMAEAIEQEIAEDEDLLYGANELVCPPSPRAAYAQEEVRAYEEQYERATPEQRELWKQAGRTEESVYLNAYAYKQRELAFEASKKEARGEPLDEYDRQIKAIADSQAPQGAYDVGIAVMGIPAAAAKALGKAAIRGGRQMGGAAANSMAPSAQMPQPKLGGAMRADAIPEGSKLEYLAPGRVRYDGVEFRAVRDLGHLSERDLQRMLRDGVNPKNTKGVRLDGHHHQQRYHRDQGAFMIEIPDPNHCISNPIQHPLGNSGGLTDAQRADWKKLRVAFNKERARTELLKRNP